MNEPKPEFWTAPYSLAWQNGQVADAYQYRPSYPAETFGKLAELAADSPRRVLDLGCGTGGLARYETVFADHVDALDISAEMIERGKRLPNGDSPKLHWTVGRAEEVTSSAPYALITAGESLHWMDWQVLMPRLGGMLSPNGTFAICIIDSIPPVWDAELHELFRAFSTIQPYRDLDLVDELVRRGLFTVQGSHDTAYVPFVQSIAEYTESFHARSGLAHGRMTPERARAFDSDLQDLLAKFNVSQVEKQVRTKIVWGIPHGQSKL